MACLHPARQADGAGGGPPAALREINASDAGLRRDAAFAARSTVVPAESQPLVLLVEDSEPLAELYLAYMQREPTMLRHTATLAAGKAALLALRPAALLLDLELPDGSGLDLIETARTAGLDCAAIVITGHGPGNVPGQAQRAGAYDFFV